jgi:hypothetical protein
MALISVALPVWRAAGTLGEALGCVLGQTHRELEVLLVLNGSDEATRRVARDAAAGDARVRVIELKDASLPAALNVAIREATAELVARMDADDWCPPARLARQAAYLAEHPKVGAVGSAWEVEEGGRVTAVVRPPVTGEESRWRLLVENPFAHGSMMLRKAAVLGVGGYDEALVRAQDYGLWVRLSREWGVCAVPDVLYRHRRAAGGAYSASELQAQHAAGVMVGAWGGLPAASKGAVVESIARAMGVAGGRGEAWDAIERGLTERPTREGLMAWLWVRGMLGAERGVMEVCRGARVREVAGRIVAAGAGAVWLWGAGAHCPVVMGLLGSTELRVLGLVDDRLAGQERFGFVVEAPAALGAGDHVLLASDAHEGALWDASAGARARGVRVWRLYAE